MKDQLHNGWPNCKSEVDKDIREYFNIEEELSIENDVIVRAHRIIIPQGMRKRMMEEIHYSHSGITACLNRAREIIFWPGMTSDIKIYIKNCITCNTYQRQQ